MTKTRRVLLLAVLALAVAASELGVRAPNAAADQYGFSVFVPGNSFAIIDSPWRHISKVNAWYPGEEEILISAGLTENGVGLWGEARNRSNQGSIVTLDTGNGSAWFRAIVYNLSPYGHTINGNYQWPGDGGGGDGGD